MNNIKIIQTSRHHTASTLLVNILYGLICPNDAVYFLPINKPYKIPENTTIVKTHKINIDDWINKYGDKYKLFFVVSERKDKNKLVNPKYKNYANVLIFQFEDLIVTKDQTMNNIIDNVYTKLNKLLCYSINMNNKTALKRIINMNNTYNQISDKPFSYIDTFYHIHGSHRSR